jgi:hypothetical protein
MSARDINYWRLRNGGRWFDGLAGRVRWLGDRKAIEAQTETWDKTVIGAKT